MGRIYRGATPRGWSSISGRGLALIAALLWLLTVPIDAGVVRIMPLGDSLTSSIDGQASYRYWLWYRLKTAGLQFDFVGSQWGVGDSAPPYNFDADHEGHPGFTTRDILDNVYGWAAQARPQIVLLLIGANDLTDGVKIGQMMTNLTYIIYKLRYVNPYVRIVIGTQPPLQGLWWRVYYWNWAINYTAGQLNTAYSPIKVVDLWSNWSIQNDTVDGTHPNATGENIMAYRWYVTLASVFRDFGQYAR